MTKAKGTTEKKSTTELILHYVVDKKKKKHKWKKTRLQKTAKADGDVSFAGI